MAYSFVLGYHGCTRRVGEDILAGAPFRPSQNDYDWLGWGIYFWEANPWRALDFSQEAIRRKKLVKDAPFVIGAVIDLGECLDLTTSAGVDTVRRGYKSLQLSHSSMGLMPQNSADLLRRNLDCAVIERVHAIFDQAPDGQPFDTVRGIFIEGGPAYEGAGILDKTHVQIAVRNPNCLKGVFRVPDEQMRDSVAAG